jgi:CRP-like cAMP-binding protein
LAPKDPKVELIRSVPLFASCSAASIGEILRLADEIDVPAGRVLIREGSSAQEFFIIVSGSVRVERGGKVLAHMGPGEFLGEIALVDHGPRTATVTVDEPSRLLVLGPREFRSLLAVNPAIQTEILQALARRVRRLEPDAVQ